MGSPETIRVVTWVFTMLSLVCVILRFYTRIRIVRSIGADDITIVVAWVFSLGLLIIWEIQIPYGLGKHLVQIPFPNWTVNFKMLWATLFPYYIALCFVKVSVILQCLRIFKIPRFRIACWALLGIVVAYTIWAIISAIITCHPVAYTWDKFIPGGYCSNQVPILYTNAGISIATDWAIVFLPLPVLKKLNLNRKERWGLIGVFSLGVFASVTSILRLHNLIYTNEYDITYAVIPTCIWSTVEINTGIMTACGPALRPIGLRIFRILGIASFASSPKTATPAESSNSSRRQRLAAFLNAKPRTVKDSLMTDSTGFTTKTTTTGTTKGSADPEELPLANIGTGETETPCSMTTDSTDAPYAEVSRTSEIYFLDGPNWSGDDIRPFTLPRNPR